MIETCAYSYCALDIHRHQLRTQFRAWDITLWTGDIVYRSKTVWLSHATVWEVYTGDLMWGIINTYIDQLNILWYIDNRNAMYDNYKYPNSYHLMQNSDYHTSMGIYILSSVCQFVSTYIQHTHTHPHTPTHTHIHTYIHVCTFVASVHEDTVLLDANTENKYNPSLRVTKRFELLFLRYVCKRCVYHFREK